VPTVASYHTILAERIERFVTGDRLASRLEAVCHRYEAAIYDAVDLLITPTPSARQYVRRTIGPDTEIRVVSNGIDTRLFRPVDSGELEARYGIDDARPLIGYTGRHSHEKYLQELIAAVDGMDVTLVLAGDGPARPDLERQAEDVDCEVVFPGFLDRGELPAFYSMLDVFAFAGRIETQGLVALEANACGTPVVAVDAGALAHTVVDGRTGYHYPPGDIAAFSEAIKRAITETDRLQEHCLERRELVSVEHTLDQLTRLYKRLLGSE
jgi:glycosyltransferase involved in cell wall biosynthesis